MIYLASPYTHQDPAIRQQRFRAACWATAMLLRAGKVVFAPIVHSHPLVEFALPTAWSFWERVDRVFLERCDEVMVLMLAGWQESVGVREEIRIARELGKPVWYLALELVPVSPTLAHVVSGSPEVNPTPTVADRSPTLAHVASEVP